MPEWRTEVLDQLVTFQKGRKVRTQVEPGGRTARYLGASALEGGSSVYAELEGAVIAEPTDVLMLWDGERSGLVGRGEYGVVASTVSRLTPREGIDPAFLYYALSNKFAWIQARRTGTGIPHVPNNLGKLLHLTYPISECEQRRIADVLGAVDKAIESSQCIFAKLLQMKQGSLVIF